MVTPDLASTWADEFLPTIERVWDSRGSNLGRLRGAGACLASLYAAGRYDELLALRAKARFRWWHGRR